MSISREGILLCLVGPAGSGKSTLADRLLADTKVQIKQSISVTSRAPRTGEKDGQHYFFVSRETFQDRINTKQLFEWEEIHGNFYGTPRAPLEQALHAGQDLLLVIDIKGALNFKRAFPENTVIAFLTPSSNSHLMQRITSRGGASAEEVAKRMKTAEDEYQSFLSDVRSHKLIDYLIINDQLDNAYHALTSVIYAERLYIHRMNQQSVVASFQSAARK